MDKDADGSYAKKLNDYKSCKPVGSWNSTSNNGIDCDDDRKCVTTSCTKVDWYLDNDGDFWYAEKKNDYKSCNPDSSFKWNTKSNKGIDCNDNYFDPLNLDKSCVGANPDNDCDTSVEDLKKLFPNTSDSKLKEIADAINKYGKKLGIDTKEKLQHFLAQAAVESHNLNAFKEYTNYRPARAVQVFSGKFNPIGSDNQDPTKKNLSDFYTAGNTYLNAESFFNWVYADENRRIRSRLGNTEVGDGWKYRGRGIIQLTGRENYTNFSNWYKQNIDANVDIKDNPSLLESNTEIGTISGLYFFKTKILDKITVNENTNISAITKKVNTNLEGAKERKEYLIEAKNKINCK